MARIARRLLLLPVILTPVLTACGFRPVYAPAAADKDSPAAQGLAEISVGLIPERSGQLLRLALQERFERAGIATAHRYDLNVTFGISAEQISIQENSTTTWQRMVGTANYSLITQDPSRATLIAGAARSVDGFNLFDRQFFTADLETEAVTRRLAEALADQITLKLASFFATRAAAAPG
jgi:LPS-assembly lipoprotein